MIVKRGKNLWYRGKRVIRALTTRAITVAGFHPSSSRQLRTLTAKNILHINLTGFGTDPQGEAHGMRVQADVFHAIYPESDYVFNSYRELDGDPLKFCSALVKLIDAGNAAGNYTHILLRGHSFGGAACMFFLNWIAQQPRTITLAVLYDPVPNPMLGQGGGWKRPASAPAESICFTQRRGQAWWLVFPTGTKVDGMQCVDVTDWEPPTLFHSSMIADPRVWDQTLRAMRKAVSL